MRIRSVARRERKSELMMTAMIDVVFLLLVFFIMTFRIVAPEGDFNVEMPAAAAGQTSRTLPPIRIRLLAGASGELAGIRLGDRSLNDFDELHAEVRDLVADCADPADAEVELDCDYPLRYDHAVDALTAISGYIDQGQVVSLLKKIRFARPKKPSGP